ncbi:hypothetical protein EGR_07575 [Echinococcus granulosus]|uniref:Uncharacterized protein n=1 Tax=Echinococcus granulosus TaxID=6210 RepID=W6UVU6_ECHGR|nr:hypothetical protein EGR_07575 [Echinococcus granulosus]EUB57564.1 hypothetical protein EGR_07575 [Echinococcus granulosus]
MKQNMTFLDFEDEEELEGEDGAFKDTIIEPPSLRPKPNKPAANSQQGRAPTLTIEVVRVGRPLKFHTRKYVTDSPIYFCKLLCVSGPSGLEHISFYDLICFIFSTNRFRRL